MSKFPSTLAWIAAAAALLMPLSAAAQTSARPSGRPYRALFGGDPNDTAGANFTASLFGAYDDNVLARSDTSVDPRFQQSGYFAGAMTSLSFVRSGERISLALSGMSGLRYYPDLSDVTGVSYGGSGVVTMKLRDRTTLRTGGGFLWSSFSNMTLTPVSRAVPDSELVAAGDDSSPDYAVTARRAALSYASLDAAHSLTRRATLGAGAELQLVDFEDDPRSQRHDVLRGQFAYRVTRYSTFRVGYAHRQYRLGRETSRRSVGDVTAGIDYSRPLSLSGRRTTFTIQPGSQLTRRNGRLEVRLAGSATLRHDIGRTWAAEMSYRRGMRFLQGVEQEIFTDMLQAGIGGMATRRIQVSASAGYSGGETRTGSGRDYSGYSGSARIRLMLSRHLALYSQYLYFNYRFDEPVPLPMRTPRQFDRHGVRAGLSIWAPILR